MSVSFSQLSTTPLWESSTARHISAYSLQVGTKSFHSRHRLCQRVCGLKRWMLKSLNLWKPSRDFGAGKELRIIKNQNSPHDSKEETGRPILKFEDGSLHELPLGVSAHVAGSVESPSSIPKTNSVDFPNAGGGSASLCIADVGIFGYSRRNLTDEDLRSIIASTLTCRIDHQQNCDEKLEAFLSRTYYVNGGFDNREGMSKLNAIMEQIKGQSKANRICYLSVPQEALLDVASCLADNAQAQKGWNRVIIEKPLGFDPLSSHRITQSLLSKFAEKQLYRIDHLLGKNLIENLTVLRFSNLDFEPLWSRTYIRNVQVILSEDFSMQTARYYDGYGIIRDIVHSHILQTIALLAMEPPISVDGEDIRNEKVKVLRSIRKLDPADVILGQYKATAEENAGINLTSSTPTYFAAALYIDNARWDGVPFLIKTGMGLIKHSVEIRIQFRHVPGNLYRERIGHSINLATNESILRDVPDEASLSKLTTRYNSADVPDSYEHLLLDVVDGDNHLFLRSDELAAARNILSPVLNEIGKNHTTAELYELGGRGPIGAYYLWAKHGVQWVED
ncbi:hypothetical protein Tsubulata_051311 [Turnera subulata]|uniref:Glucose-6-phosphate dehydrogenase (NADP(+)) n=1 Tax=Turnera subulata TaxID=218843 RepID=A0A9Q0GFF4_9ROSI|nr:hypothetical protein Tsubulata_051311 [Turnera subulata]